jgi:hypothetical protein
MWNLLSFYTSISKYYGECKINFVNNGFNIFKMNVSLKRKGQTTTWPLCRTHSGRMWMGDCLSNQQHDNGINLSPKLLSSGSTKPQWEAHITSANSPFLWTFTGSTLTQTNQQDRILEIKLISSKFTEFIDSTSFLHSRVFIKNLSTLLSQVTSAAESYNNSAKFSKKTDIRSDVFIHFWAHLISSTLPFQLQHKI